VQVIKVRFSRKNNTKCTRWICEWIIMYGAKCWNANRITLRFIMKSFQTSNKDVINECRTYFNFKLLSYPVKSSLLGLTDFFKRLRCYATNQKYSVM